MNKKDKIFIVATILAIALVGFGIGIVGASKVNVLGGLNHNAMEDFSEGISVDGTTAIDGSRIFYPKSVHELVSSGDLTTLVATATTTTAAVICDSTYLKQTPTANVTFRLPSAATLIADCIPTVGDSKTIWYDNMSASYVLAVETETNDLIFHTAVTNDEYISAGEIGRIDLTTLSTTSVSVMMTSY